MESRLLDILKKNNVWELFVSEFPELARNSKAVYFLINSLHKDFDNGCRHENPRVTFQFLPLHFQAFYLYAKNKIITEEQFRNYLSMISINKKIKAYSYVLDNEFADDKRMVAIILENIDPYKLDSEDLETFLDNERYNIIFSLIRGNYDLFKYVTYEIPADVILNECLKYGTKIRHLNIFYDRLLFTYSSEKIFDSLMSKAINLSAEQVTITVEFISKKSGLSLEKILEIYYSAYGVVDIHIQEYTQIFYTGFVDAGIKIEFLNQVLSMTHNSRLEKWLRNNLKDNV